MARKREGAVEDPGFRPRLNRTWTVAVLANVLLFTALVVVPWIRGRYRAVDAQSRFARYAACLWGAEPADAAGLGLPEGEHQRFAHLVLDAEPDWPARCRAPLADVAPDEAMVLFPTIKNAEEQVREAVRVTDRELAMMSEARRRGDIGRVSERPLLATGRLLAALSVWTEATGETVDAEAHAIAIDALPRLVDPTRVPLSAAIGAPTRIRARADGVVATSVDGRALSWVRVGAGRVDLSRVRRPGLFRDLVRGGTVGDPPWGLWATPDARCAARAGGCAGLSSGVGRPFDEGDETAARPGPTWLAGHPAGPPEDVALVTAGSAWLVALRTEPPHAEVRVFSVDATAPSTALEEERTQPRPPLEVFPLEGTTAADAFHLVETAPPSVVFTRSTTDENRLAFLRLEAGARPVELGPFGPDDAGAIGFVACDAVRTHWIVASRGDRAALVAIDAEGPRVVDDELVGAGWQLACDDEVADVVVVQGGELRVTRCDRSRCGTPLVVARRARDAAAVRDSGVTVVAFSGGPDRGLIRTVRLPQRNDDAASAPLAPAACWDPDAGLCGPPLLSAENGRVLLAAREHIDLRIVESTDGGVTWRPMTGVR
jgi:hypothetical protein